MEVIIIKLPLILLCYGEVANTTIPDTVDAEEPSELIELFKGEILKIENRYEEKLEKLRNELLQTCFDEINEERQRNFDAIQQLQNDFIEKETSLTTEINNLKDQLITERNDRNQEVERLKATITESKNEQKMDLKKGKDITVSEGALTTKINREKDTKKKTIKGLKRQTAFYGSTQVAFSARLTVGQTPSMSPNQDIVFNDVLLNVGSAYHNAHGTFVAPVSGVYYFTTSLLALGTKPHHAKLVKDGQELARVDFNDDDNFDDSSQAVIVQLKKGDIVAVQNADYSGMRYAGSNYSTFSGFLIYEYEDMSPVVGK